MNNDEYPEYLVFVHARYYPEGGWNDFVGRFLNIEDCKEAIARAAIEKSKDMSSKDIHFELVRSPDGSTAKMKLVDSGFGNVVNGVFVRRDDGKGNEAT